MTVESKDGKKTARVIDETDAVVFEGPINTPEELDKVPAKARKILEGISMQSSPGGPVL